MIKDTTDEVSVETAVSTAIDRIRQAILNPYVESAVEEAKMSEKYLLELGRKADLFKKMMGGA
jgi:hypothetical protein